MSVAAQSIQVGPWDYTCIETILVQSFRQSDVIYKTYSFPGEAQRVDTLSADGRLHAKSGATSHFRVKHNGE